MPPVTDPELIARLEALSQGTPESAEERMAESGRAILESRGEPTEGPGKLEQFKGGVVSGGIAALPFLIPPIGAAKTVVGGARTLSSILKLMGEPVAGALGEKASQKLGYSPEDPGALLAAAVAPGVVRGTLAAPAFLRRGTRGLTALAMPQAARESGIDIIQKQLAWPPSGPLFTAARSVGSVPTRNITQSISDAIDKEVGNVVKGIPRPSIPNRAALRHLVALRNKYAAGPAAGYDDLISEVQRLRDAAGGFFDSKLPGSKITGKTLSNAAKTMLAEMDKVSPAIAQANKAYRRESGVEEIIRAYRKPAPSPLIDNLFDFNPLVSDIFSEVEKKQIKEMSRTLGRIPINPTMGSGNRMLLAFFEAFTGAPETPLAQDMLRVLMRNTQAERISRPGAVVAAQTLRGALPSRTGNVDTLSSLLDFGGGEE